jgi:GDP-L-fucose synthase
LINIGSGEDVTIRELAETVMRVVEFKGRIVFDETKPDGTPRKLMDSSRLSGMGWRPRVPLEEGVRLSYRDYLGTCG